MELPQEIDFFHLLDGEVNKFILASTVFGEPMTSMANKVGRAFEIQLRYMTFGLRSARPSDAEVQDYLQELSDVINEIQGLRDTHRGNLDYFNHLSTVAESINALNWIRVPNTPVPFIRNMTEAGDYFGNRVLSSNRGQQQHIDWVNHWRCVMTRLNNYVRQYFETGFTYGVATVAHLSGDAGPAVPPPPPPPPMVQMAGGDSRAALLNELNQGLYVVRMLRHATPEVVGLQRRQPEGSHLQGDGPPAAAPAAQRLPFTSASGTTQPREVAPVFLLDGRKWRVEHVLNNMGITVIPNQMSESLAMFDCNNVVLEVSDKINGVSLNSCRRVTVILKDIISSVELIGCVDIKLKCLGVVPNVTVDSSEMIKVFLSEEAREAEQIWSRSSNSTIYLKKPDGDYVELPVPEQIRSVVVGEHLRSSVVTIN